MTAEQTEAREERHAICECEKVSEEAIKAIFRSKPDIFGISEINEKQGVLI